MELGDEEIVTNKNSNHLNEPESTTNGADVSPSDGEIMLRMFKDHLLPDSKCDVTQMGPTSLAYIGDVIFELFVRTRYVWPARRTSDLQNKVVNVVRGKNVFCFMSSNKTHVESRDRAHAPHFSV